MQQDPEYLKNQSRYLHRLHRRNRRFLRYFLALWFALFASLTAAAALDVVVKLGWNYTMKDVWGGIGMMVGGCLFWLFARGIMSMTLAMSRRIYGPEPTDRPK
jgi:hypothetical protein